MSTLHCDGACPHAFCNVMRSKIELTAALAACQVEVATLKEELESHANQEVAWKLALDALKADIERLTLERDGLAATERVNAFTIRNVSTQRDTAAGALERARGLLQRADRLLERWHEAPPWRDDETSVAWMTLDFREQTRAFLATPPTPIATPGTEPKSEVRTLEEWSEDDGAALWWKFPVVEPPYSGSPLSEDFPDYVTHWTRTPIPDEPRATPGTPTEEET